MFAPTLAPKILEPKSAPQPKTILLVDDSPSILHLAGELLRRAGYRVIPAADSAGALLAVEIEESIDLLLSDIVMPGLAGTELAAAVQRIRPALPVLLMSGDGGGRIAGYQVLPKPFTSLELLKAVDEELRA